MKKISILSLTVALALFVTSCSKEKTCECDTLVSGTSIGTSEVVIEDGDCSDLNSSVTQLGITTETTCTEK